MVRLMKKTIKYIVPALVALFAALSCNKDRLSNESVIKDSTIEMNAFDYWLESNLLRPYNIDFKYRFELNESDMGFWTVPPTYESAIIYAHLVKYLCVETYDEIAGITFTRSWFPKMFFLVGEWEYRSNNSKTLGTAEAGKKIMLAGANELPFWFEYYADDPAALREEINAEYIKVIHHEFTHILNQTKEYSDSFKEVTAPTYVADACFDTDDYWHGRGYVTAYAQSEPGEDFAEILSEYITHDAAWWDALLKDATSQMPEIRKNYPDATDGATYLTTKLDIVREYMQSSWNIDIDKLRDIVSRRTDDVVSGLVDLTDVTL